MQENQHFQLNECQANLDAAHVRPCYKREISVIAQQAALSPPARLSGSR